MQLQIVPVAVSHRPRRGTLPSADAGLRAIRTRPGRAKNIGWSSTRARDAISATSPVRRSCRCGERLRFAFDEVDIEGDEELELEYGIRIPVVEIDGEEAFEVTVDPIQLAGAAGREGAAEPLVNL